MQRQPIDVSSKKHVQTYVLHVDGDNFFVSCELVRFPELKGKPVIVGEERGIASALSYEAKALGITRGMPVFEIRKKFPQVYILPSHFELYEQYAHNLYSILKSYSNTVERYSIDECFAYISLSVEKEEDVIASDILNRIKKHAESSLGITLSFGLAKTKTLAKIGSKYNKPSGCTYITEHEQDYFLKQTPIGNVWGIGRAISSTLTSYNITTAYEFTKLDPAFVKKKFGGPTYATWNELKGIEMFKVKEETRTPKSFQSTRSFGKSIKPTDKERSFFYSELSRHAEMLCARLRSHSLSTPMFSFFLKKKSSHRSYIYREVELGFYTNNPSDICTSIERTLYTDTDLIHELSISDSIKATGITVLKLKPVECLQNDLFSIQDTRDRRNTYMKTIDELNKRLGERGSIHLCSSLASYRFRQNEHLKRNIKNKFIYGLPLPYMGEVH